MSRVFLSTLLCFLAVRAGHAAESANHFDGKWDTILSCPNSSGALGYSFEFPSLIKESVLHGEKGVKGQPGWLQLDGPVSPDGTANLYASGLVGAAEMAVGRRPPGTQYAYHLDVQFDGSAGKGQRVEGRPCTVDFRRLG